MSGEKRKLVFEFDDEDCAKVFLSWFWNSGEQNYWEACDDCEVPSPGFQADSTGWTIRASTDKGQTK